MGDKLLTRRELKLLVRLSILALSSKTKFKKLVLTTSEQKHTPKMSQEEMFDGLYMNVAQRAQGIDGIFDSFFGFLQRTTDFFQGASSNDAAETFALKASSKQWDIREKKMDEDKKRRAKVDGERKESLALSSRKSIQS